MKLIYKNITAFALVIALLIGGVAAAYYASAQTSPQTPSTLALDQQRSPIAGSVKVPSRASTLASLAKIDILKAIGAATGQQNGTVIAAHLDERDGFLVYQVVVLAADGNSYLVMVDAGTGNVLSVTKLPAFGPFGPGRRGGRGH
jgi:uncharacterized membrane protein YkoI